MKESDFASRKLVIFGSEPETAMMQVSYSSASAKQ